ncbi:MULTISPECIES: serine hydrolase domain-containing protein [Streptomyces]|uniref:Serine hydrolase domain-containing protein n=1 Tax=Streptomyces ramulosus TaxID=47762 RepID=A0ABW1FS39_9ACTN
MKRPTTRTLTCALAGALTAGVLTLAPAAHAAPQPAPGDHRATAAALRALVEKGGLPGAAATVRDGTGRWSAAAGHADTTTGRERDPESEHFRGASITKTFIATVLLQLEAEGRLSLADSVEKWLPGLVRGNGYDGKKITLRSLLNHTSGLANHTEDPAFAHDTTGPGFPEHRYDTYTPEELVATALKTPPRPDPEKKPYYSNTAYVIAGMVIEKATGRGYAEEVTRRIIRPLKLTGISFPGASPRMPEPHPVAYSRLGEKGPDAEIHDATEQNMTWLGASGDIIVSGDDLNRFQRALLKGRLLPRAQLKEMLVEVPAEGGYGFGLGVEFARLSCGVQVVGKTGSTNGSLSASVGTPDGKHQLTFNANGDWLQDVTLYTDVIEAEFCGKTLSARKPA